MLDKPRKVWCLLLLNFYALVLKIDFWWGDWIQDCVPTQYLDSPNIS